MKLRVSAAVLPVLLVMLSPLFAQAATPNPHNAKMCLLCHKETPRFGVDTRETVTFRKTTRDDPELCYHCHDEEENLHPILVEPGSDLLGTKRPGNLPLGDSPGFEGKVVCTTCHFLHAAETDHALLRGFPGSQQPGLFSSWQQFCRECHGSELEKRSPHAGDERACTYCHQTLPEEGKKVDVVPRGEDLCSFCHGTLRKKHFAGPDPFGGKGGCGECHDPHLGPESPARLKQEYLNSLGDMATVNPHYSRALCFPCHLESKGDPLREDDPVKLCNRCHGTGQIAGDIHPLRKVPDSISPPAGWPLRNGSLTCLTCHTAGHWEDRENIKFLRGGPYETSNSFCPNCHDPKSYSTVNPHLDINQGKGCDFCHSERPVPGQDTIDTVKLISDPNLLCLRCHEIGPHPAGKEHTMNVDPQRAAGISKTLPLLKPGKIVCATCHNPHIEEVERHKLRGGLSGFQICVNCHSY